MAIQFGVTTRNARLDAIETAIGTTAMLRIFTGAQPANCAAADSGTKLAELTLPSDWMNAAGSGTKTMTGTWEDTSANATGTAAHFRIYESTGTTCHIQGACAAAGSDMNLTTTAINSGDTVTITSFTITDGNA